MPKIGVVQQILHFIIEKDGALADTYMAAEHDVIYLPIPKNSDQEEIEKKAEEWGVSIEEDSFVIYHF